MLHSDCFRRARLALSRSSSRGTPIKIPCSLLVPVGVPVPALIMLSPLTDRPRSRAEDDGGHAGMVGVSPLMFGRSILETGDFAKDWIEGEYVG